MTPWTVVHRAPLSMEFFRQEYRNGTRLYVGMPFPPPEDLPNPGIECLSSVSPALQVDSLLTEPLRKPNVYVYVYITHCNSLAWRIPWTEKSGGLQSMGLQRIRHN